MRVVVVDAGGANLGSVCYALERLWIAPTIAREASDLDEAERVILPGVGAAGPAMACLSAQGLVEPLRRLDVPLLGICLGMQLLYEASEEGDIAGLGVLPGKVVRMHEGPDARVPHMGWNTLSDVRDLPLLDGIRAGDHAFFVHGYAVPVGTDTIATTTHGGLFSAVVQRGTYSGAQFHPERSAEVGARLLRNFIDRAAA